jgi:hypothetical protein
VRLDVEEKREWTKERGRRKNERKPGRSNGKQMTTIIKNKEETNTRKR